MKNKVICVLLIATVALPFAVKQNLMETRLDEVLNSDVIDHVTIETYDGFNNKSGYTDVNFGMYCKSCNTLEELRNESDTIVIGTIGTRSQVGNSFNSTFKITKTLKGSKKLGEEIKVFEPAYIRTHGNIEELVLESSYIPMNSKKEYILFLRQEKAYNSENQFNLISSYYGKFRIDEEVTIKKIKEDDTLSYKEIEDIDFLMINIDDSVHNYEKECTIEPEFCSEEVIESFERYDKFSNHQYLKVLKDIKKTLNSWDE